MKTINKLKVQTGYILVFFLHWLPFHSLTGADMHSYLLSAEQEAKKMVAAGIRVPRENRLLAWVGEPEARFNLSGDEQSIGIRFRPKFAGEWSTERVINELEIEQCNLIYESVFNAALKKRYLVLVDILAQQEKIDFLVQEENFLRAEINLKRKLVQTNAFNPSQLEMIKLEASQLEQQITLHSNRLELMSSHSGITADKMSRLLVSRSTWLLPLSELVNCVEKVQIKSGIAKSSLHVRMNQTELTMAKENLKYERKRNNPLLKFMELKYQNKRNNSSEVTLGFAISLGRSTSKLFRRGINVSHAQTLLMKMELETAQSLEQKRSTLVWHLDKSKTIEQTIEDINQRISRHNKAGNPQVLLELKKKRLSQQQKLWNTQVKALRSYIEFLHSSGQLVEQPLQNWLVVGQPLLKGDQG